MSLTSSYVSWRWEEDFRLSSEMMDERSPTDSRNDTCCSDDFLKAGGEEEELTEGDFLPCLTVMALLDAFFLGRSSSVSTKELSFA